jgi:hypothetical protein
MYDPTGSCPAAVYDVSHVRRYSVLQYRILCQGILCTVPVKGYRYGTLYARHEICCILRLDKIPLDHISRQMLLYTTQIIYTIIYFYKKRLLLYCVVIAATWTYACLM